MSEEIKRYRFKGAAGEYVYENDYDAAQSELAALREDLTTLQSKHERTELALSGSMKALTRVDNMWKKRWLEKTGEPAIALVVDDEFKAMFEEIKSYRQRLTTAEQRNAVMTKALERITRPHDCGCVPCTGSCTSKYALEITLEEIREIAGAALNPTESGASE